MSGNPFRRNDPSKLAAADEKRAERTPSPFKIGKKEKRVKIQTPPHSPEEPPRRLSAGKFSEPPPPERTESESDSGEESGSTATADEEIEAATRNTRRNSGSLPPPAATGTASMAQAATPMLSPAPTPGTGPGGPSGAPYNPFARTLATSDAAFGLQKRDEEGQARQEGGKKGMDVDMFKNILMTGSPAPTPPHNQRPPESSSGTDTSSLSRPSLFDPSYDLQPGSPRSSFDSVRYSDDEQGGDEEKSGLMGANEERLDHFAPPAPPKPGQTRATRAPQTVSFADFGDGEQSMASASNTSPTEKTTVNRAIPPMLHRQTSDLNKPLPAPPPLSPGLPLEQQKQSIETQSEQPPTPGVTSPDDSTKKAPPPPPPVSRRGGQVSASTTPNRARSTSNTTQTSVSDQTSPQPKPAEMAPKTAAPPPPPPSRKSKPAAPSPKSAVATPAIETSHPPPSTSESENKTPTQPPQPPPRRNPSTKLNQTPSMQRSPSSASHSSSLRSEPYMNNSSTTGNAPPAPPPRRGVGASKRQSFDGVGRGYEHRSSFDSTRSSSVSKSAVSEEGEKAEVGMEKSEGVGRSVLDDMSAFQAEIDALRAQQQGVGKGGEGL